MTSLRNFKLPFFAAILSVLPFLIWLPKFKLLYWFHDDWELLNDWTTFGTAAWIRQPMGENFAPVFKLLWVGAIYLTGGSYLGMITLLWITHLAILFLLAMLLVRCDFSANAAAVSVLLLGLAWTNIEILGWATQWSALLCTLFLMIAWVALAGSVGRGAAILAIVALVLGGATFVRGIPYGAVLGVFWLLSRRKLRYAALLFATSLILSIPYGHLLATHPNFQHMEPSRIAAMALWARNYLLLNPLYLLLSYPAKAADTKALWIFGAMKILVMMAALLVATEAQRRLLWTLLLFEIANAALIASGRYDTGSAGEISSRYQYAALLCFGPFLGVVIARMARAKALFYACLIGLALAITIPWGRHLDRWSYERGTRVRESISSTPDDQRFGLPSITAGRAHELIAKYRLH